jgi:hypothetical protein
MSNESQGQDSLEFLKSMWSSMGFSLPGMVTPTVDVDELGKRIADLKAVEGWLKMNLNMLQMSIQGLEMQRAALTTMQAFSQTASGGESAANPFAGAGLNPSLWPWNFMQQAPAAASSEEPPETSAPSSSSGRAATSKPKKK